jgi:hypothetical protein
LGDVLSGDITATLETNLSPPVKVYSGEGASGGGLLDAIGVRAGVVVRSMDGKVLARLGDPVPFEPLRAALVLAGVVGVVVLAVMLVRRAVR